MALGAVAAGAFVSAPASAATIEATSHSASRYGWWSVDYTADPGERNDVTATAQRSPTGSDVYLVSIHDEGATIRVIGTPSVGVPHPTSVPPVEGDACVAAGHDAHCVIRWDPTSGTDEFNPTAVLALGDGDDRASVTQNDDGLVDVHGDTGNDAISGSGWTDGGDGDDVLSGNATEQGGNGNDVLTGSAYEDGGPGDDRLVGTAGGDQLTPGTGTDDASGGAGEDNVRYDDRGDDLSITLDDVADDGAPGEGDNIHADVEDIDGGRGSDHIVGSDGPNLIVDFGGDNVIDLGGGDDHAVVYGDRDDVDAGSGDDTVSAWFGADHLVGGPGSDRLDGSYGDDTLDLRDGETDAASDCGVGNDTALADPFEVDLLIGCEAVS